LVREYARIIEEKLAESGQAGDTLEAKRLGKEED